LTRWALIFVFALCVLVVACGSGKGGVPTSTDAMSGNWQFTLKRVANPVPLSYSGFLLQAGDVINGAFILGGACSGVGAVTGTLNQQSLQLDVNEFGQDLTLTGTVPSAVTPSSLIAGQFSTLPGGCSYQSTGTWSAVLVPPLTGNFHGSFVSTEENGTVNVTGALAQGTNIGASNASLSGNIATSGTPPFCSYIPTATITGVISGTTVNMSIFGFNGSLLNTATIVATLTNNGTVLTGNYGFSGISKTCTGDTGTFQLNFP
jgi:hypothetical protein